MYLILCLILVLVAASSLIIFQISRKRARRYQLEHLKQKLNEKREEILRAVISFRSLINSESYISKGEYSDWCTSWNYLRPLIQKYSACMHALGGRNLQETTLKMNGRIWKKRFLAIKLGKRSQERGY